MTTASTPASVRFHGVQKRFGAHQAVRGVDLELVPGECLVLLGPSGCGKTTLLRLLAGLERPDAGTISIGERVINDVPPADRDVAMVFQNYALYPHLTVRRNIAFPLEVRRRPENEIRARVDEVAARFGLDGLLDRRPAELSGGQQQRVAVARAVVRNPAVYLMDEPLSNLDAQLRTRTRGELKRLQRDLATTTLYVTHDQSEAMTLGQRVALMKDGEIHQLGTPLDLYRRPVSTFVAGFLGSPPMNLLAAEVTRRRRPGGGDRVGGRGPAVRRRARGDARDPPGVHRAVAAAEGGMVPGPYRGGRAARQRDAGDGGTAVRQVRRAGQWHAGRRDRRAGLVRRPAGWVSFLRKIDRQAPGSDHGLTPLWHLGVRPWSDPALAPWGQTMV